MKAIKIYSEQCIGCSLCSLECSITWNNAYGLNDSFIIIKRSDLEGHFEAEVLDSCKRCFKCVKICPSSCIEIVDIQNKFEEVGLDG
ncbi:MAG TPA: hypothetical protein DCG34_00520 [Clostridiales bacterium]|nr:hypothetical protein [Clostridiales bacterium]